MRWLKYAIVLLLFVAYLLAHDYYTTPAAVRAYRWNRTALEELALHPPELGEDERKPITDRSLYDAGFVMMRRQGDCICFYHQGFMAAIDSWHEIIYSPKGASGLPDFRIGDRNTLYRLHKVDDRGRWYYAVHS